MFGHSAITPFFGGLCFSGFPLRKVCCFVLLNQYWGIVTVQGFPRVNRPQIIIWGGQILTLHLDYIAGFTNPLLFLFKRTHQLTPLTTRGKPWRLRVWAGPKLVRLHRWGPWFIGWKDFLGTEVPRNCEILHLPRPSKSKPQHLFFVKKKQKTWRKETLPREVKDTQTVVQSSIHLGR